MAKLRYYWRVLTGMRLKKMMEALEVCRQKSGRSKFVMFFDMLWCMLAYGAGYYDYKIFGFYDLTAKQRATYVTRMKNKRLIEKVNDREFCDIYNDKNVFAKLFKDYLRRDFLDMRDISMDGLAAFIKGKDVIFAKPNNGTSGYGIEKLRPADFADVGALYDYLTGPQKQFGLLEQEIRQHPAISALYPLSINTFRIVTLVDDKGEAHIVYTTLKMGDGGRFVDNLDNGGMCVPVDPERGCLVGVAHTARLEVLDRHPYTGVVFDGYKLPFIYEAHAMVKEAALVVPQIRYSGWDICIMPDGPAVVESNNYPGYDFWQLPEQTPDKTGLWPTYKKLVPGLR